MLRSVKATRASQWIRPKGLRVVFRPIERLSSKTFHLHFSSFETSAFKDQESLNSNWLPMSKSRTPSPRPGSCRTNDSSLPESSLNFLKHHTLLDESVTGIEPSPVFIRASMSERLTVVAVDRAEIFRTSSMSERAAAGSTNSSQPVLTGPVRFWSKP